MRTENSEGEKMRAIMKIKKGKQNKGKRTGKEEKKKGIIIKQCHVLKWLLFSVACAQSKNISKMSAVFTREEAD